MVNVKKEALISALIAERAEVGGGHCSNCGHCVATL